jgi:hypothetical protein
MGTVERKEAIGKKERTLKEEEGQYREEGERGRVDQIGEGT